jgi:hypothetical protein
MSKKLRSPFVGHPDALLFWRISQEGVFQQPQAISLKTLPGHFECNGDFSTVI